MLTELGTHSLFVYAIIIGSIVALSAVYFNRKKRVK